MAEDVDDDPPCSPTRRRVGCRTKSPTPGISILAKAEMTDGAATVLTGRWSRHVATGPAYPGILESRKTGTRTGQ
jgi:hypothetical protein